LIQRRSEASFGSTVCAIRSIGQSVSPGPAAKIGFDASTAGNAALSWKHIFVI
jgi:hypothetical protein